MSTDSSERSGETTGDGLEPGEKRERSHARTGLTVAALAAAAGTFVLGALNVVGAGTGPVVNVVGAFLLVGAFVGAVVRALAEPWRGASRWRRMVYVGGLAMCTVVLLVVGLLTRTIAPLHRMAGTMDVAVVGYLAPASGQQEDYDDLADALADTLSADSDYEVRDYATEVDPPLNGLYASEEGDDLDRWVENFEAQTDTELVVAGYVQAGVAGQLAIRTFVYVPERMASDAGELTGWYFLDDALSDRRLDSPRARLAVLDQVVGDFDGLATFLAALDAWQAGYAEEAARAFGRVIEQDPAGRIGELALLFHGHALETMALGATGERKLELLDAAGDDYRKIPATSPISVRARLSAATNGFLRAYAGGCERHRDLLARSSRVLAEIGADVDLPDVIRRKAQVNQAQVELCRQEAGIIDAGVALAQLLPGLTTFAIRDGDPHAEILRQVKALALSVEATVLAQQKRFAEAIESITSALSLDPRFERQYLWRGLRSVWLLYECHLAEAAADHQDAVRQLQAAIDAGRAPATNVNTFNKKFAKDMADWRGPCAGPSGG